MSLFLVFFAGLVALALLLLLPGLLRRRGPAHAVAGAVDARRANLAVLREQLAALDAELRSGALDPEQHRLARIEIERRALEEEQVREQAPAPRRAGKTALALGLFIPLFVFVVYALVGDPQAMLPPSGSVAAGPAGEVSMAQIEAMVDKLAQRLEAKTTAEAGDDKAWTMLARSFAALQRYPEASRAYGRARALSPDNAQLLADHADVLAMLQGQSVQGEPRKLVDRALQLDPKNLKALALAGSAAFELKDYATALKYWGEARQVAPAGSEFATGLESSMQQAREAAAGGAPAGSAATTAAVAPAPTQTQAQPQPQAQAQAQPQAQAQAQTQAQTQAQAQAQATPQPVAPAAATRGVVRLDGALAAKVAPGDTVFVFARAAQGPRMPLAIIKRTVADLPLAFSLDDTSAMSPELKLSRFPSVVIGARISRSGDAMPRRGDLVGQVGPVDTGSGNLVIVIDAVQP